jgi:outer membrane biosynthesis protein TonB
MTSLAKRAVLLYALLILVLAVLGAHGQMRYRHNARLLMLKDEALVTLAARRAEAAAVNGPLAVTTWARSAGMVPAPEAPDVMQVAPSPVAPPAAQPAPPYLEIRTVWR